MNQKRHRSIVYAAFAVAVSSCGSDDFNPGLSLGNGSGGAAQASLAESVVTACTSICTARRERACATALELTASECSGPCSFLKGIEDACQQAMLTAYECQLSSNPCVAGDCNDLLRAAETACAEYADIIGGFSAG